MRTIPLVAFALVVLAVAVSSALAPHGNEPAAIAAGCVPTLPHAAGSTTETVVTSGISREYILHVPPSYNGSDRVPLVFSFHGLGSSALAEEIYSGLSTRADQSDGGFIAVYPQGTINIFGQRYWNVTQVPPPEPDDVQFASDLLDELESELCIDAARVFSSGMSNGAMMSVRLACSLSSRIAAIAPVAGAYYPALLTALPSETCQDTRAVPVIAFHGTADTSVPFNGGTGSSGASFRLPLDNDTPDDDVMQSLAAHNGCTSERMESAVSGEVRLVQYDTCTDGAVARLYAVDGGGHTWPGSFDVPSLGYTTHDISATDLMWDFFQAHPMTWATPPPDSDGDTVPDADDPDNDNDGCSDVQEAQNAPGSELTGGLRSHKNPYDYFNPTHDGQNRVDDIIAVAEQYFIDAGNPAYNPDTDRTFVGPDDWDLGPPNGQQRVDDIVNAAEQFFHDCA